MSGPAIVVVAGIATLVIAVVSFDGMVADDYYKRGLAVNRVLEREARAQELGVSAALQFDAERGRVRVILAGSQRPASLRLTLVHPTLPAEDQGITLAASSPGVYDGSLRAPRPGTLQARLEDPQGLWVLAGRWRTADDALQLTP